MSIATKLASALERRDEQPNIDLAKYLIESGSAADISELEDILTNGPKPARHDAIKVLYEIGARRPSMLAPSLNSLIALLQSKDNRMLWGALSAIDTLGDRCAEQIMPHLNLILETADRSSVIAKDKTMHLLASLNSNAKFSPTVEPVLFERLTHSAVNQFPMYAEFAAETVSSGGRSELIKIIRTRHTKISFPAKKARLEKLLKKILKA